MIPPKVRAAVLARAEHRCERCGRWLDVHAGAYSLQHRQPRGSGGTKTPDSATNLAALCGSATTGCHGWVESYRLISQLGGWLVRRGDDPATVPIQHHEHGPVLLTEEYTYAPAV